MQAQSAFSGWDLSGERLRLADTLVGVTEWAAWGTAAGTLVLAAATFAAVRSSNRSARVAERALLAGLRPVPDPAGFAQQQRDIHVPAGDAGCSQAAIRDPHSSLHADLEGAIVSGGRVTADLLYTDHQGGQPTITRFVLLPADGQRWRCDVTRHWTI